MEGVDGGNVGEDALDHLWGERASACFFCQPSAKHLEPESGISRRCRARGGRTGDGADLIEEMKSGHVGSLGLQELFGYVVQPLLCGLLRFRLLSLTGSFQLVTSCVFFYASAVFRRRVPRFSRGTLPAVKRRLIQTAVRWNSGGR